MRYPGLAAIRNIITEITYLDEEGQVATRNYNQYIDLNTTLLSTESETNALIIHKISTPEEFMNMQSGYAYELINDIDMSGYNWVPYDFNGNFDGKGHKISNLTYLEENEYSYTGFGIFSDLDGIFKNVYFENLYINIATDYSLYTEILCGKNGASLKNIMFSGNFNAKYDENGLNGVSVPYGDNIYAVDSFKLNDDNYKKLDYYDWAVILKENNKMIILV